MSVGIADGGKSGAEVAHQLWDGAGDVSTNLFVEPHDLSAPTPCVRIANRSYGPAPLLHYCLCNPLIYRTVNLAAVHS